MSGCIAGPPLSTESRGSTGCALFLGVMLGIVAALGVLAVGDVSQRLLSRSNEFGYAYLERVPGGVIRGHLTSPETTRILAMDWRDDDRLTFIEWSLPPAGEETRLSRCRRFIPVSRRARRERDGLVAQAQPIADPWRGYITQYDLRTGERSRILQLPENMACVERCMAWDGEGERVALLLRPVSGGGTENGAPADLYAVDMKPEPTWRRVTTSGVEPGECMGGATWMPSSRHLLLYSRNDDGTWRVGSVCIGTGEWRDLADGFARSHVVKGAPELLYLLCWDGLDETGAFSVTCVSIIDGTEHPVEARDVGHRPGPIRKSEMLIADLREGTASASSTSVGALDVLSGELRWVADDLPGAWYAPYALFRGNAISIVTRAPENGYDSFAEVRDALRAALLSPTDGRLTDVHALVDCTAVHGSPVAPGTRRVVLRGWDLGGDALGAWHADLAVLDFTYPDEITGPTP